MLFRSEPGISSSCTSSNGDASPTNDLSSLTASAFDALPPVVSKRGPLAQEAVLQVASASFLDLETPLSLEFGMMLGFQQLAASVKAAAPACLGRVLRFHKRRDLESRFLADLPWNLQQVVDGILASFCKEAVSYVDRSVQQAAAEAIYVSVREGHGRIAALLSASLQQRAL